jgi:hypothetical protein
MKGEAKHRQSPGLSERVLGNKHPETTDKQIFLGVLRPKARRRAAI